MFYKKKSVKKGKLLYMTNLIFFYNKNSFKLLMHNFEYFSQTCISTKPNLNKQYLHLKNLFA